MLCQLCQYCNDNVLYYLWYFLYFVCSAIIIFWFVIWLMHFIAIKNAQIILKNSTVITKVSNSKSIDSNHNIYFNANANNNSNNNINANFPLDATSGNKSTKTNVASSKYPFNAKYQHFSVKLPMPGVSIIKPLVGIDANLLFNLTSYFELKYPNYELLFCVQDDKDPAIYIVKHLLTQYPHIDAKLFISNIQIGVNPKINNMLPAYQVAKYDLLLVSDASIYMRGESLFDMVNSMGNDIALVHQLPFVCDQSGFHHTVEKVYFGTSHARAYLTADYLNINCPSGMSSLMRKFLIDEVGGFEAFAMYLAEDFFFAKSFTDRGWRIKLSSQPALQNASTSDMSTLNARISRWIKLRFFMVPHWTLLEPFSECLLLGLLVSTSTRFIFGINPLLIFTIHISIWIILDYLLLTTIQNGQLAFSKFEFLLAWLLRECSALAIYLMSFTNLKVRWKARTFRLRWGGEAEEIFSKKVRNKS